ncbi:MAG TPA: hypothetical protein VMF32_03110 [Xanthobacteraceae bacterium]|nr:hypothetical protein [Xanthobacteraceae bacterium]
MNFRARLPSLMTASIAIAIAAMPLIGTVLADEPCSGHQLLPTPRLEMSCQTISPELFVSPDKATRALVYPTDISLYATPDMESRVVFRSSDGTTLTSQDYSSPRGANGYYVFHGQWSPDSQYFVFSMSSSGGHSPWSFPTKVYSVKKKLIANFSDMIGGNPTVSGQFQFSGPHTLVASTWKKPGVTDDAIPVSVDLEAAFGKLPTPPQ